jgi:hypothetical protein
VDPVGLKDTDIVDERARHAALNGAVFERPLPPSGVKNRHFHQIDLDDLNLLRNRFEIGMSKEIEQKSVLNQFSFVSSQIQK